MGSEADGRATVGLVSKTAAGFCDQFGFRCIARDQLPEAMAGSPELAALCQATARPYSAEDLNPRPTSASPA